MATFIELLETPTAGKAGHVAASSAAETRLVRIADANINPGLFVCEGATPGSTMKAPTTAAEAKASLGCLIDPEFLNDVNAAAAYLAGNQATILQSGYIWAECEETVAIGDQVYVRHTSDGSSNTVLGKVRKSNDFATGLVLTPSGSYGAIVTQFALTLSNGVVEETFTFTSDASPTAAEIAAGFVALIDASANFAATGTTTITVTSTTGVVEVVGTLPAGTVITTNGRATALKGARFASARSGAGIVKVKLQLRQD
jgi:hypothetical protein